MNKYAVFLLFLLMRSLCVAQPNASNYEFKIDFEPSFITPSQVIIQKSGNTTSLNFKIFDWRKKNILEESEGFSKPKELKTLEEFLKTYEFKIKGSIDTAGYEDVVIRDSVVRLYNITLGTDGVTVKGTLTQNNNAKHFVFWSPKEGTKNAELISIVFAIMRQTFIEKDIANYLEDLKRYFPHN